MKQNSAYTYKQKIPNYGDIRNMTIGIERYNYKRNGIPPNLSV